MKLPVIASLTLVFVSTIAWSGSVYKCIQADGSVTFSNIACPQDTVDREYKGQTGPAFRQTDDYYNPYSVVEQARRIDEKNSVKEMERKRRRAAAAVSQYPASSGGTVSRSMSYEEALRRATMEAGYREYGRLSEAQKNRVHDAMRKYNFLPPKQRAEPPPPAAPTYSEGEQDARLARPPRDHGGAYYAGYQSEERKEERKKERDNAKQAFEKEQKWRDLGTWGRENRYDDAVRDCKRTGADCW